MLNFSKVRFFKFGELLNFSSALSHPVSLFLHRSGANVLKNSMVHPTEEIAL